MKEENILLSEWDLPPFDKIHNEDFEPAIRAALAEAERNVEAIATSDERATFENTVEALEAADRRLQRVSAIMMNLNECCTSEELQETVMRLEPELTRFSLKVMTDRRLYERVASVQRAVASGQWPVVSGQLADAKTNSLTTEQQTLLEEMLKGFRRHGVDLEGEAAERYKKNEEELTELKLRFSQNALKDLNAWTLHLTDEGDLEGLPESVRTAAREEAASRGLEGWVFSLAAPSYSPFMTYSARRDLRERMYRAYGSIGNRGNENDNNAVIRRIVELRAEQARLLGYDTYCDYVLCDRMVRDLPTLQGFMQRMKEAVLPEARRDLGEVASGQRSVVSGQFMPWDFAYYAERLRRERYDLDEEALRPYFPLEAVREGIFGLYGRLYGLRFEEATDVPVYHEEVKVYRVNDGEREMGLLYLDMHPRASKRSGAWMTEFRGQWSGGSGQWPVVSGQWPVVSGQWPVVSGQWSEASEQGSVRRDVRPQIQVVCNFSKPTAEAPALLRFSEVETFMHEMGHAMHGMLSEVRYESLSGTNVKRDFVEMPSQAMENWCYEPEFLATFARHYRTGEVLPTEYIEKIRASQNHLAAWYCLRQLNLGMTDIKFHTWSVESGQWPVVSGQWKAEAVEAEAMENLLPRVEGCCTATNFGHIFGGGYASGYYGYKWAEVLDADIYSRFKEEGIFNTDTAARFRREILARGGTVAPDILFRNFMGRDPDPQALLRRMGLCSGE